MPLFNTDIVYCLFQVVFHDVGALTEKLFTIVEAMQKHFSAGSGTYYSDAIFFLSVAMHRIMPTGELWLDVDVVDGHKKSNCNFWFGVCYVVLILYGEVMTNFHFVDNKTKVNLKVQNTSISK